MVACNTWPCSFIGDIILDCAQEVWGLCLPPFDLSLDFTFSELFSVWRSCCLDYGRIASF